MRNAFRVFHAVLALGLLVMSLETLTHALRDLDADHAHLAVVSGVESLGAALLLIPRTLRAGGMLLLVVLLGGFVLHLVRREWEPQLLVFAAGVWLVMSHGSSDRNAHRPS